MRQQHFGSCQEQRPALIRSGGERSGMEGPFPPPQLLRGPVFALVSVVDLELSSLCPCQFFGLWQCTGIWGATTPNPAGLKGNIYWGHYREKKKDGAVFLPVPCGKPQAAGRNPPWLAKAVPPQSPRCFLQPLCKARLGQGRGVHGAPGSPHALGPRYSFSVRAPRPPLALRAWAMGTLR